jgi:RNA 2',3'-cyclic 3'-phosphodiesterase
MRLFVALEIPLKVREELASLIKNLREAADPSLRSRPKWVRPENLHLTLKFIGEVADGKVDAICGALVSVPQGEPIELEFRELGFFPNERRPRVLWAGIKGSPRLQMLAADVESALERSGIPREQRAFQPHLTLARFDPPGLDMNLGAAVAQNAGRRFGSLRAHEFHLIESKLKPSGAEYTTVKSFPFLEAEA